MSARDKKYLIGGAILFVAVTLFLVNFFIYPFKAQEPNFSDVEQAFSRIQIPADWQQIDASENRGRFGRTCPIEPGSRCFSKGAVYKIDESTDLEQIQSVYKSAGCSNVSMDEVTYQDTSRKSINFECTTSEAILVDGTFSEENGLRRVSIYASTE